METLRQQRRRTTFVIEAVDNMLKHLTGRNIAETFDIEAISLDNV